MLELTVRLIASLAVVVGLMLLLARLVGKRYGARAGAPVQVVHRQALSRSASVAVITVGSRVLVVGTTDHQVSLLTELDPEELVEDLDLSVDLEDPTADLVAGSEETTASEESDVPARAGLASLASRSSLAALVQAGTGSARGTHRAAPAAPRPTVEDPGTLAGSLLSPQTWRQAIAAATGKAS